MAIAIQCGEQGGLAAAINVADRLREAWESGEDLVLDLGAAVSADISLIQVIEAARVQARAEGRTVRLVQPANSDISQVLGQSGLLWADDEDDLQFWFHQGKDA